MKVSKLRPLFPLVASVKCLCHEFSSLPFVKTSLRCIRCVRKRTASAVRSLEWRSKSSGTREPGLIESIYERCLLRELELPSISATTQKIVRVEYKGLVFDEPLRFDLLVDECLLVELKAVEVCILQPKRSFLAT